VFAVSRVVPVRLAGRGAALDELDESDVLEEVELEDDEVDPVDDVELPDADCKTCCTMLEISLLVRVNAAWLAILARPLDKVAWALAMMLLSSVSVARVALSDWPPCQKLWSCCQNEGVLPILPTAMAFAAFDGTSLAPFMPRGG
jgi:hypothetical protein